VEEVMEGRVVECFVREKWMLVVEGD